MCLGVPGRVVCVDVKADGQRMGKVSFGGVLREVCLDFVPEAQVGQYVLVHVGFALSCLDAEEADKTLSLLKEMGQLAEVTEDGT